MKGEPPFTGCFLLLLSAFACCPLLTCGGSSIASSKHGKSQMSSRLQDLLDDEAFDISLPSSEEKKKVTRRPWQKKRREEADTWPEINGTTLRQMKQLQGLHEEGRDTMDQDSSDSHKLKKRFKMNARVFEKSIAISKARDKNVVPDDIQDIWPTRAATSNMTSVRDDGEDQARYAVDLSSNIPVVSTSAMQSVNRMEDSVKKLLARFGKKTDSALDFKSLQDDSLDLRVVSHISGAADVKSKKRTDGLFSALCQKEQKEKAIEDAKRKGENAKLQKELEQQMMKHLFGKDLEQFEGDLKKLQAKQILQGSERDRTAEEVERMKAVAPETHKESEGGKKPIAIVVDFFADPSCPWCYVGRRQAQEALGMLSKTLNDTEISLVWQPYLTRTIATRKGELVDDYLKSSRGASLELGGLLELDKGKIFKRWKWWPNSFESQRLLLLLKQRFGPVAAIMALEVLQRMTFEEGMNIGSFKILCAIAIEFGVSDPVNFFRSAVNKQEIVLLHHRTRCLDEAEVVPFFHVYPEGRKEQACKVVTGADCRRELVNSISSRVKAERRRLQLLTCETDVTLRSLAKEGSMRVHLVEEVEEEVRAHRARVSKRAGQG